MIFILKWVREYGLMSAAINIPIDLVIALALSDSAEKGCLNAMVRSCWCVLAPGPASDTPGWCRFKCVAMLDVLPLSNGFLVAQCLHTATFCPPPFFRHQYIRLGIVQTFFDTSTDTLTSITVPEWHFFRYQFYKIHFNAKKMTLRYKSLVLFFSFLAFFTHSKQFHNIKNKKNLFTTTWRLV